MVQLIIQGWQVVNRIWPQWNLFINSTIYNLKTVLLENLNYDMDLIMMKLPFATKIWHIIKIMIQIWFFQSYHFATKIQQKIMIWIWFSWSFSLAIKIWQRIIDLVLLELLSCYYQNMVKNLWFEFGPPDVILLLPKFGKEL